MWKRLKKIAFITSLVLLFAVGFVTLTYHGFFAPKVDGFLTTTVQSLLEEQLQREVSVEAVHLSFPNPKIVISNIAIAREQKLSEGTLFSAKRVQARVLLRSLLSQYLFIDDIILDTPSVWIQFDQDGQSNLPQFGNQDPKEPKPPSRFKIQELIKRLTFPHVQLIDGDIYFAHQQQQLTVAVERLNTTVSLRLEDLRGKGKISLEGGTVEFQDRGSLAIDLAGEMTLRDSNLSLSSFLLQAGSTKIEAEGEVRNIMKPDLNLAVEADISLDEIDRIAQVNQNLSGLAHFSGHVTGTLPDVTAGGRLICEQGTAWRLGFEGVDANVQYHDKQLLIPALGVDLWDGTVQGSARLSFAGTPNIDTELVLEHVELAYMNSILDDPIEVAGPVSGTVKVGGESFDFADLVIEALLHLQGNTLYGVDIAAGTADIALREQTVFIHSLETNIFEGQATAKGLLELYDDFDYQVDLDIQDIGLASVMSLIPPESPDVSGKLSGTITAEGSQFSLDFLELESELALSNLVAYDVQAKTVRLKAAIQEQTLSIPQLSVQLFSGEVEGTGKLALGGETFPQFEAALELRDIALETVMQQFAPKSQGQGFDAAGIVGGHVACRGTSFALQDLYGIIDLTGTGHLKVAGADTGKKEEVPFDLRIKSALEQKAVTISSLQIESSALHVDTSGTIDLQGPSFDLAYHAAVQDLQRLLHQALGFVPGIEQDSFLYQVAGNIETLQGTLQGPVSDLTIEARAHVSEADLVWARVDDLTADIAMNGSMLTIQQVQASYKNAAILASGTIDLTGPSGPVLDIPVCVKTAHLSDYLSMAKQELPIDGTLQEIDATIRGTADRLEADMDLIIHEGAAWGQGFDAIIGKLSLSDNRLEVESLTVKKNGGIIDLTGFLGFDQSFEALLTTQNVNVHDIDALESIAVQYEGLIALSFEAKGSLQDPRGKAHITFTQLSYNGTPIEDITCDIAIANQEIEAEIATFRNKVMALFSLGIHDGLRYKAELVMQEAAVEQLLSLVVELEELSGLITGTITSEGSLNNFRDFSADIKLSQLDLVVAGRKMNNSKEIDIVLTEEELIVNSLELIGQDLGVFAQGFLDFQGHFALDLDGILDLRPLRAFLPRSAGITALNGRAQVMCSITGTVKEPLVEGLIELNQGSIKLDAYPDPITAMNGKVAFTKNRIELVRLSGKVSEGNFTTEGFLAYQGLSPEAFEIKVKGEQLELQKLVDELEMTVSPEIRLSGNMEKQSIDGEIVVHDALYGQEIDLQSFIRDQNRKLSLSSIDPDSQAPQFIPELFLKIRAPKDVRFKNKLADIQLKADLLVQGTVVKPQIEGRVQVLDGKITFGDVRYDILGGILDFIDPLRLNPEMNIQVETVIQEYKINLGIEGNLNQFLLNMSSDPPLSDSEIAQIIAVGSGAQTNAYNFVTRPLQTLVEGQLEKAFRLDRISVDVDPLLSGSKDSEMTPTVTLAKRFFDALMFTYTTSVGGVERSQLFGLEYEISDKVSITAQTDEQGEYNTSVVFKFKLK
ncbi:hypothetical protein CSA56_04850 [candidate division KSB3 bacterium]|uniref:Translocation and assembly module TamB C-terminal domain-containing protein n=1 Tax=candidate division KSB3 bacterium TaxID=2044937 RepID=A0A2G6KKB6_9BACT|nr:MAG: hypothetical protein CSA56_04850 [candidate division KSB3 bacterium]